MNPAATRATVSFMWDGQVIRLEPGQGGDFPLGGNGVVSFHRGGNFGPARYTLQQGVYRFSPTPQGWELYLEQAQPQPDELPNNSLPGQ